MSCLKSRGEWSLSGELRWSSAALAAAGELSPLQLKYERRMKSQLIEDERSWSLSGKLRSSSAAMAAAGELSPLQLEYE